MPSTGEPQRDLKYWSEQMAHVAAREDQESFLRIYDHFAPRLHRYLLGLGAPSSKAEDLVQDAMLRAWRGAKQFDASRASLATWLFRITRNLYIDSVRRKATVAYGDGLPEEFESGLEMDAPDASAPESYADQVRLGRAIEALPATQARLVRMSFLEARSHSEIASELGMPLGSVKSTLRRAFARLRNRLLEADA
ncbi:sigma-70 family RNA polymerase sigma factor [Luteimonas deserti]|uniref:RNA polymerase sigma factor n=1 Tax=Luteimonas deserti TaxID=2752306 RepID=A0A7Z0QMQ3_9GAMM|nr:sigma-70 family RNA polymerase sigma factor [Luteimonas deserti]NYZ61419.1 sigma-70 family RNA polymerase sigma factor [Luteimonas deserti]